MNFGSILVQVCLLSLIAALCACGAGPNDGQDRLVVSSLDYHFLHRDFKIDSYLNLSTLRRYQVHGQIAYHTVNPSDQQETINSSIQGDYTLKVLVLPEDDQTSEDLSHDAFYSADQKIVAIKDGVLDTEISLPYNFSEHPLLTTQARLYIELTPTDPGAPSGKTLEAPYDPLTDSGKLTFSVSSRKIDDIAKDFTQKVTGDNFIHTSGTAQHLERRYDQTPRKLFESHYGLMALNEKDLKPLNISHEEIKNTFETLKAKNEVSLEITSKFCGIFYTSTKVVVQETSKLKFWEKPVLSDFEKCLKNPGAKLVFAPTEHVIDILSRPRLVFVDAPYIVLSSQNFNEINIVNETAHGVRDTKYIYNQTALAGKVGASLNFKIFGNGVGAGLDLMNEVGIRYGKEWFEIHQHSERTVAGERQNFSINRNIQVDQLTFDFKVQSESCFVVASKIKTPQGPIHVCLGEPTQKNIQETWSFLSQTPLNATGQGVRSRDSFEERLFSKTIRGQENYHAFVKVLADEFAKGQITLSHIEAPNREDTKELVPVTCDGTFPGLISSDSALRN